MKQRLLSLAVIVCLLAIPTGGTRVSALTPTQIRWYVGLGTGSEPAQVAVEQQVVDDFNAAHPDLQLVLEVVPFADAVSTLANEIAIDNSPDIVGPVGWSGSQTFHGEWQDLDPLISAAGYDTSQFPSVLVDVYHTDDGQEGLPFALYPSSIFYNAPLFVNAGLYYPPARYGDQYEMPDGTMVTWNWDTIATIGKLLTLDASGKNATQPGFDRTHIVQYGWSWNFEREPEYVGSYFASGTLLATGGTPGNYHAQIPDAWRAAWHWTYDGIWGTQPFIPDGTTDGSPEFGNGNAFSSGKIAMIDQPVWYTCCAGSLNTWEAAALPSYNGQVAGRVDADTFRILKTSHHQTEAFTALSYLIGDGVQKLLLGSGGNPPAFGAMPARSADQLPWRVAHHAEFPWVQNWKTIVAGLDYPDNPHAESWMPNFARSWSRGEEFYNLFVSDGTLDLDTAISSYQASLENIFNGLPPTDIGLSNNTINENLPVGSLVGTLSTTDADSVDFSYALCGAADDSFFRIDGNSLETAAILDFESKGAYAVCVRSTDDLGLETTKAFNITLSDVTETVATFVSAATQDGWILESTETSNTGGSMDTTATTFQLGDDATNRQYRVLLSFNTSALPDTAVIQAATLKIRASGVPTGTNPFNTLGSLFVDLAKPYFGSTAAVQLTDFNIAALAPRVGTIGKTPVGAWYSAVLTPTGRSSINRTGPTQFRLAFAKDDNNNHVADFLKFFSGNGAAGTQPVLVLTYYQP
jgi:multiple sugar transport system substrate-binding protein